MVPLFSIDRSSRQKKINNSTSELNCTIDQKDLTGIYGVFYSATAEYPFCSVILGTFSKIDHM
jgi:hypothetical protein